ncbi:hypothetical protein WJ0W_006783 [Paenibacillus melissococcoides]|uniref:RNA polymerase sigma-70 region 4 domain-containing protein n=1 Tax=Paenibacillus melissococcoides TaxID=2912268 RepID=A0ABN8UEM3_9BACL|nr:hypothetical protein WJ0W_006783 [Paenibacillus melissococcoides]
MQEYDGYNHREIAQKYELSERRVREICDGILPVSPRRDENQLQLFDDDELK